MTTAPDEPFVWTDRQWAEAIGFFVTTLLIGITVGLVRTFDPRRIHARATRHHR